MEAPPLLRILNSCSIRVTFVAVVTAVIQSITLLVIRSIIILAHTKVESGQAVETLSFINSQLLQDDCPIHALPQSFRIGTRIDTPGIMQ